MREVAVTQAVVDEFMIDGRKFNVERIVWSGGDLSYDVYDDETGLCLTPEASDDQQDEAKVRELLDGLRASVENDEINHFYEHDIDTLCRVLSKKKEGGDA